MHCASMLATRTPIHRAGGRLPPERQSLMNSHRQSRWLNIELGCPCLQLSLAAIINNKQQEVLQEAYLAIGPAEPRRICMSTAGSRFHADYT